VLLGKQSTSSICVDVRKDTPETVEAGNSDNSDKGIARGTVSARAGTVSAQLLNKDNQWLDMTTKRFAPRFARS
jgi:hypothetical protein